MSRNLGNENEINAGELQGIPISSATPVNDDVLQYQSASNSWVPTPVTALPSIEAIANIGGGVGVWSSTIAGTAYLNSLVGGTGVSVTNTSPTITINSTFQNLLGTGLYAGSSGGNNQFKGLVSADGSVTIVPGGGAISLQVTDPLPGTIGPSGDVLTSNGTSAVWQVPQNIYNNDGTIAGNRVVTLGTNSLVVNGTGIINLGGSSGSSSAFVVINPAAQQLSLRCSGTITSGTNTTLSNYVEGQNIYLIPGTGGLTIQNLTSAGYLYANGAGLVSTSQISSYIWTDYYTSPVTVTVPPNVNSAYSDGAGCTFVLPSTGVNFNVLITSWFSANTTILFTKGFTLGGTVFPDNTNVYNNTAYATFELRYDADGNVFPISLYGSWQVDGININSVGDLEVLSDVSVSGIADQQLLVWDNVIAQWVNGFTQLSLLSDCNITSPTDGQFLVYNTLFAQWQNQTVSIPGTNPNNLSGYFNNLLTAYGNGYYFYNTTAASSSGTFNFDVYITLSDSTDKQSMGWHVQTYVGSVGLGGSVLPQIHGLSSNNSNSYQLEMSMTGNLLQLLLVKTNSNSTPTNYIYFNIVSYDDPTSRTSFNPAVYVSSTVPAYTLAYPTTIYTNYNAAATGPGLPSFNFNYQPGYEVFITFITQGLVNIANFSGSLNMNLNGLITLATAYYYTGVTVAGVINVSITEIKLGALALIHGGQLNQLASTNTISFTSTGGITYTNCGYSMTIAQKLLS